MTDAPSPLADPRALPWISASTAAAAEALAAVAAELARPAVLTGPPGCVRWLGPGWFPTLAARLPETAPVLVLADCGGYAGDAATVLGLGVGVVVPEVPAEALARLRALAAGGGLPVLAERQPALALDGLPLSDALARCRAHLLTEPAT